MKINIKIATAACAAIVALGMIGCGGGGTPTTPPTGGGGTVIPDYAKQINIDVATAKRALNVVDDGGIRHAGLSATPLYSEEREQEFLFSFVYEIIEQLEVLERYLYLEGDHGMPMPMPMATMESSTDEGEVSFSVPCAYQGDYEVQAKWLNQDSVSRDIQVDVTFNDCVHNRNVYINLVPTMRRSNSKYAYNGNMKIDVKNTNIGSVRDAHITFEASSFSFVRTEVESAIVRENMTANFTADIMTYRSWGDGTVKRASVECDGKFESSEFNSTGGLDDYFALDAIAFKVKADKSQGAKNVVLNGYAYMAPDTNMSLAGYVYGENFVADYIWDSEQGERTFNGLIGTTCLGGTVMFDTTQAWDVNKSMNDIDGNNGRSYHPTAFTPFAGKTTIAGANGKVVLEFGKTDTPESYATMVMEGTTPTVADRSTLYRLRDRNCTSF